MITTAHNIVIKKSQLCFLRRSMKMQKRLHLPAPPAIQNDNHPNPENAFILSI